MHVLPIVSIRSFIKRLQSHYKSMPCVRFLWQTFNALPQVLMADKSMPSHRSSWKTSQYPDAGSGGRHVNALPQVHVADKSMPCHRFSWQTSQCPAAGPHDRQVNAVPQVLMADKLLGSQLIPSRYFFYNKFAVNYYNLRGNVKSENYWNLIFTTEQLELF